MGIKSYLSKLSRHSRLFYSMMGKLGNRQALFDLPHSSDIAWRAVHRCMDCEQANACESWLKEHETAESPPGYCRNIDLAVRLAKLKDKPLELGASLQH